MWVAAAFALLMLLGAFCLALRQVASIERRLQQVLSEEAQRLSHLKRRLVQLESSEGPFVSPDDPAGEAVAR